MSKLPSEYLEEGWCQGRAYVIREDEGLPDMNCFIGAVSAALEPKIVHRFLCLADEMVGRNVVNWNDMLERTQVEVIALARMIEVKLGMRPMETEAVEEELVTV